MVAGDGGVNGGESNGESVSDSMLPLGLSGSKTGEGGSLLGWAWASCALLLYTYPARVIDIRARNG